MKHNWLGLAIKAFLTGIKSLWQGVVFLAVWVWLLPINSTKPSEPVEDKK